MKNQTSTIAMQQSLNTRGKEVTDRLRRMVQAVYADMSKFAEEHMDTVMIQKGINPDSTLLGKTHVITTTDESLTKIHFSGSVGFYDSVKFEHWFFADLGRRPGGLPPRLEIQDWMAKRGIDPSYEWYIRNKIAKKGVKGKKFIGTYKTQTRIALIGKWDAAMKRFKKEL